MHECRDSHKQVKKRRRSIEVFPKSLSRSEDTYDRFGTEG